MSVAVSAARRKQIEAQLDRTKARFVTVAGVDVHAQLRGQIMGRGPFSSALKDGVPFLPEALIAIDVGDQILPAEGFLDFDNAFSDQAARVVADAPRQLPFYPDDANSFFFAECPPGNSGHGYDPRIIYQKAEQRLAALSLYPVQGFEFEFRVYRETAHEVVAKKYQNLTPLTAISGYMNVLQQAHAADFIFGLLDTCRTLDVPIAGVHFEHGLGMLEAALGHQKSIRAPDNAVLFKTFTKAFAARQDTLASFMAKPNADEDGGCLHTHVSLVGPTGRNAFYSAREPHNMSPIMRHFIAGIQKLLPELFLMIAPNANSMRRFVVDHFAPVAATWGLQNRTTSIRVVHGSRSGQRIEFRPPGADANPYLVLACLLGAGAWGIERQLEPTEATERSTYERLDRVPKALRFPATFQQAINRLRRSKAARELFGDAFVDTYAGTREAQLKELKATPGGRAAWNAERARFLIGA